VVDPRNVAVFEEKQYGTNYEDSIKRMEIFLKKKYEQPWKTNKNQWETLFP